MVGRHRWQLLSLILMSVIGIGFGVWLFRAGFILLGCAFIGVFLWRGRQFAVWLFVPHPVPPDVTPQMNSWAQRLLLSIVCLLGAAVCAVGVYLWHLWPEEWQAGLVFILFGLMVLAPVTIWDIKRRRKQMSSPQGE